MYLDIATWHSVSLFKCVSSLLVRKMSFKIEISFPVENDLSKFFAAH